MAEPGLEPGRWIFQPGHLTWRALVYSAAAVFTNTKCFLKNVLEILLVQSGRRPPSWI